MKEFYFVVFSFGKRVGMVLRHAQEKVLRLALLIVLYIWSSVMLSSIIRILEILCAGNFLAKKNKREIKC